MADLAGANGTREKFNVVGKPNLPGKLSYSLATVVAAFLSATVIGIAFGFMPARSAARLNPVDALARE